MLCTLQAIRRASFFLLLAEVYSSSKLIFVIGALPRIIEDCCWELGRWILLLKNQASWCHQSLTNWTAIVDSVHKWVEIYEMVFVEFFSFKLMLSSLPPSLFHVSLNLVLSLDLSAQGFD